MLCCLAHAFVLDQSALDGMVREYMTARIDLARAAEPPSLAVARDVLHDWLVELQHELLPEGMSQSSSSVSSRCVLGAWSLQLPVAGRTHTLTNVLLTSVCTH